MLYDIGGMAGPVAADRWGVPGGAAVAQRGRWDGYHEDMAEVLEPIYGSPAGRAYLQAFDDWLADTGTSLTFDDVTGKPRRCLVLIPRVMQPNADRVDGVRYRFVGPCIDPRREDPGDWTPRRATDHSRCWRSVPPTRIESMCTTTPLKLSTAPVGG